MTLGTDASLVGGDLFAYLHTRYERLIHKILNANLRRVPRDFYVPMNPSTERAGFISILLLKRLI